MVGECEGRKWNSGVGEVELVPGEVRGDVCDGLGM